MKKSLPFLFFIISNLNLFAVTDTLEWEYMGSPGKSYFNSFAIDSQGIYYIFGDFALEKSFDKGITWEICNNPSGGNKNIFIDSKNNIYLYWQNYDNMNISKDEGRSWESIPLPKDKYEIHVIKARMTKNDRLIIFAYFDNENKTNFKIYSTDNLGKDWTLIPRDTTYKVNLDFEAIINYTADIAFIWNDDINQKGRISIKSNKNTIWNHHQFDSIRIFDAEIITANDFYLATNVGIIHTYNGGQSFENLGPYYKNDNYNDFRSIVNNICLPNDHDIFITTFSGYSYSTNRGKSWINYDSLFCTSFSPDRTPYNMIKFISSDNYGNIYMAPNFKGFYKSNDKGKTWIELSKNTIETKIDGLTFDKSGSIYISNHGIYKSTDNGKNWLNCAFQNYYTGSILFTSNSTIVSSCYKGIILSTDSGETWIQSNEGYFKNRGLRTPFSTIIETSKGLLVSKYIAEADLWYCISKDDGVSWYCLDTNIIGETLTSNSAGQLFMNSNSWRKIFRSIDNGYKWDEIFIEEFISFDRSKLYFHPIESTGFIYVPLEKTFFTSDNGASWSKSSIDYLNYYYAFVDSSYRFCFPEYKRIIRSDAYFRNFDTLVFKNNVDLILEDFYVSPEGYYYGFGKYGGIYRSMQKYLSVNDLNNFSPSKVDLKVFPNPTSGLVYITAQLPGNLSISYKLFNYIGLPVATLTGQTSETVSFDVSNFPQGVYFIVLKTDTETVTKQFTVVK